MGIRMAIGADRGSLLRLVVGRGLKLALLGVALGGLGSLGLTRVLTSQLWGVSATDRSVFAGAAAFLLGVGVIAVFLPAARAARVDPVVVLKSE